MVTTSWLATLQPASFNGINFVVEGSTYTTGRRVAIHEYPYRDNPYVEDLGLNRRMVAFQGFLVGDDCYSQRDKMKLACEKGGDGTLVHPSMGAKKVALLSAGFTEGSEKGRVVSIQFQFVVVDDKPRWPANTVNSKKSVLASRLSHISSIISDFKNAVTAAFRVVGQVLGTIHSFINLCLFPLQEASSIFGLARGLLSTVEGGFGLDRFNGNFFTNFSANLTESSNYNLSPSVRIAQDVTDSVAALATIRAETKSNFGTLLSLANPLANVDSFGAALQTSIETLRSNINDPNDQIRMLCILSAFPTPINADSLTAATYALCRRMAIGSLANATQQYNPTSQTDTLNLIAKIKPLFDNEIQYAADSGDVNTYTSMRDLRSSVMLDLQSRGSSLPPLITITTLESLPSLLLAWNMYADSTREPDLLNRNPDVINPLFFDTTFEALSI